MGLQDAHFVGNSMGASILVGLVARGDDRFRPRSMVLASGGGFVPDNVHRRALLDYDCTVEGMVRILQAIFSDPRWWTDEAYVRQRHAWSVEPGVWEACAAARFKAPHIPPRASYGQPDTIPYENIDCPTLLIAGDEDKLRLPGYAQELAARISNSELLIFERTGHCPNIERAEEFNDAVLKFLDKIEARAAAASERRPMAAQQHAATTASLSPARRAQD
jgi:pimeloyl-ACP methyl ester carboxylesterase